MAPSFVLLLNPNFLNRFGRNLKQYKIISDFFEEVRHIDYYGLTGKPSLYASWARV